MSNQPHPLPLEGSNVKLPHVFQCCHWSLLIEVLALFVLSIVAFMGVSPCVTSYCHSSLENRRPPVIFGEGITTDAPKQLVYICAQLISSARFPTTATPRIGRTFAAVDVDLRSEGPGSVKCTGCGGYRAAADGVRMAGEPLPLSRPEIESCRLQHTFSMRMCTVSL